MRELGKVEIYLNAKDSLALRYLMEYEHALRQAPLGDAEQAAGCVIFFAVRKLWETLGDLELFALHQARIVSRHEDGHDQEFDWSTVCDGVDYEEEPESNSKIPMGQDDFLLLEALLRRVSWFVAPGRYPTRQEILRIALRFRATTVRRFHNEKETKQKFGIDTPRGLMPLF